MINFWIAHLYSLAVFLAVILGLTLLNLITLKRLGSFKPTPERPFVSVLVPARNEARNIEKCVTSLLSQDYHPREIIVLDDQSEDQTPEILNRLQRQFPELKVINGKPLPQGWLGKNWACHQLFQVSRGELVLFTDADTRHEPAMLGHAVSAMTQQKVDMLTALVKVEVASFWDGLLVPFMYWSVFTFFPLWLVSKFKIKGLSASVGQLMLFRRSALEKIGGYAAIKKSVIDDFQLGRNILKHHLRLSLMDATHEISCRMYENLAEAVHGFSKNFLPVFNFNVPLFVFVFVYLLVVFLEPLLVIVIQAVTPYLSFLPWQPVCSCVFLSLFQHGLVYRRIKTPAYYAFLYPLVIVFAAYTALRSLIAYCNHSVEWKGRSIS